MSAHIFGLDIGRSFIKIVQVESSGKQKILKAISSIQTPDGGIQSESPVELSKVSEAVKACFGAAKTSTNNCVVSVIESQVVSRLIELPNLTEKELAAAINWEAEQYIPMPIKDVVLQFKVVSTDETSGGKMKVLLVAAPRRVVDKYVSVVKQAGLKPVAMEPESIALSRALLSAGDSASVIVSLGAASTELVVFFAGSVVFTRSITTGGMTLTRAIMNEFNLPQNQAEQYKQTYGISEDKLSGKVAGVLKPILDIIGTEVMKAVDYTRSHIPGSAVSRVVICGGGAYLPGLSEFFVERTNLEVSFGEPWINFSKEGIVARFSGQGSLFAVATGLALRE